MEERDHLKEDRYRKKIDKLLINHKMIADDLEKYCKNKRLKKNIYKLDLMHNFNGGQI